MILLIIMIANIGILKETIDYLNQFEKNNIINDLNKINGSNSIMDIFKNILGIYNKINIDELNIIYGVKEQNEVRLFGSEFVQRNKNNCKIILNEKEQDLKEKYSFGYFSQKKDKL